MPTSDRRELPKVIDAELRVRQQQAARIAALEAALKEAIEEYEYASQYKGDYLAKKHDDARVVARLRAVAEGSQHD